MKTKATKIVGLVLIVLGVLALVYRGFDYTTETHGADLGPLKFEVKEKRRVNLPTWAGASAVIAGAALLLVSGSRKR